MTNFANQVAASIESVAGISRENLVSMLAEQINYDSKYAPRGAEEFALDCRQNGVDFGDMSERDAIKGILQLRLESASMDYHKVEITRAIERIDSGDYITDAEFKDRRKEIWNRHMGR